MAYLGIDIGGTKVAAGLVAEDGHILKEIYIELQNTDNNAIDEAIAKVTSELTGFTAIGIGVPGTLDRANKTWVKASNLHISSWSLNKWQDKLGVPIYLENDANCAALGESWVSNKKDLILIALGTGVGMGIVINNKILIGSTGLAGEAGHIIIYPDGRDCSCGLKGCLEAYAGGWALKKYHGQSPKELLQNLHNQAAQEAIEALAIGLFNIATLFGLEEIYLGGSIAVNNHHFIQSIQESIQKKYNYDIQLKIGQTLNKAGLIGAAALCREEVE